MYIYIYIFIDIEAASGRPPRAAVASGDPGGSVRKLSRARLRCSADASEKISNIVIILVVNPYI